MNQPIGHLRLECPECGDRWWSPVYRNRTISEESLECMTCEARGELLRLSKNYWKEVRRSVPAEYVDSVPDDATVWACWIREGGYASDLSLTIYHHDGTFTLVKHRDEEEQLVAHFEDDDKAIQTARRIRAGIALDQSFTGELILREQLTQHDDTGEYVEVQEYKFQIDTERMTATKDEFIQGGVSHPDFAVPDHVVGALLALGFEVEEP